VAEANRGPTQAVFGKPEGMLNGLITSDKSCWTRPGQLRLAWWRRGHFKCPCHQSTYNRYGQIISGPAPRPMSQFPERIENGKIVVDTGPDRAIIRSVARFSDATPT